ncbi:hypothetical protein [Kitasatospora sp. NBC_01539]|uniref:hypothetical protein n=1 Tax=Kitasatospora sp. NBC_01539 TaxID=2903577 RepID=UPI0038601DF2
MAESSATDWIVAVSTALALIVSIVVAVYAYGQYRLAKKVRREQSEPHIIVDIVPRSEHSQMLWVVIENIGKTVARDVRVDVHPPLRGTLGCEHDLALSEALAHPIPSLPPGKRIAFNLGISHKLLDENSKLPVRYTFTVTGDSRIFGELDPEINVVDLSALRQVAMNRETTVGQLTEIAEHLKEILVSNQAAQGALTTIAGHLNQAAEQETDE